ncbi:MAG TPA: DinB family protein [Pyrinomonadaceae bacterium]
MSISQSLLPEFKQEMANTRKTLERVPDDKFDWKPHEKSTTMGDLATHLANILTWALHGLNKDSIDIAPPGEAPLRAKPAATRDEVLETFDKNLADALAAIAAATDERLMQPWTLLHGGKTVFTLPRVAMLRGFVMNHTIHHRAQLGVYLRLNDIPVPSIYGPSADEGGF